MTNATRSLVAPLARWFTGAALILTAAAAVADPVTYTAAVSEISNTCASPVATPATGPMVVNATGEQVVLTFGALPAASGTVNASGKVRAQAKTATTHYKFSGRITGAGGMLIMVAELFTGGKPTCSQSWNLTLTK